LGSINFAKLVKNGAFDVKETERVVRIAVRMLDNVIDLNFYPTEDSKRSNFKHRPIGLGIRGFHDALYQLGIRFDSEACVQFSDESMEVVAYHAILASSQLAKERGAYSTYKGSKWERGIFPQDTLDLLEKERGVKIDVSRGGKLDWTPVREHVREYGMRNSNCMAIAPTASTANLVGCIPSIEPIYKNLYVKSNKEGNFIVVNTYLVKALKERGLWSEDVRAKIKFHDGGVQSITEIPLEIRETFREAFEIDSKWLVKEAAYRGKWIDQSQSLNIFFRDTSGKALHDIYFLAWELGLKTTYYLRTMAASQVEKSTVDAAAFGSTHLRGAETTVSKTSQSETMPSEKAIPSGSLFAGLPLGQQPQPKACSIEDPECESCQG
jgi:ribonucleoside-diphosphate reductase alpha chain